MAQHDYNVANATGANFRADLNTALQAIVSQNSGATAPVPTFAGMLWLDLSGGGDGIMRRRNQANSAWLSDLGIDQVARDAAAAAQNTANAAMPKAGGTFTGAVNLIPGEPAGNNAVSRAAADQLYQVKLPATAAGSLLIGAAGGWTGVMPAGADAAALVMSGGLPIWQATATTAAPGSLVRTLSDGTIDPTFIPAVASGLKYRGTFKPAVNAEYPTTGGTGAGGVPATGDFWVIDGLTTGGYTYLAGTLAGVTVYNGDSIAYTGTAWYRMGSTINLTGYLKTDGSIAMAGALNMGGFAINNVNGIAGKAGSPVPLTNFRVDTTNVVISPQRGATGADLPVMQPGQIGTDFGRNQIYVGAGAVNVGLLPVRFFSDTAAYGYGDYAFEAGQLWRARGAVSAGAFTASQWYAVIDAGGGTMTGTLGLSAQTGLDFGRNVSRILLRDVGDGRPALLSVDPNNNQYELMQYRASEHRFFNGGVRVVDGSVICDAATFIGGSGVAILSPSIATAGGNVLLRPNGAVSDVGQLSITPTSVQWNGNGLWHAGNLPDGAALNANGRLHQYAKPVTNWDDARANGWFMGNGASNAPTASSWYIANVIAHNDMYVAQTAFDFTLVGNVLRYTRLRSNGVWTPWSAAGTFGGNGSPSVGWGQAALNVIGSFGGGIRFKDAGGGVYWGIYSTSEPAIRFGFATSDVALTESFRLEGLNGVHTGSVSATAFNQTSDERLKSEIVAIQPRPFLADDLTLYAYTWANSGAEGHGVIAQHVQELAPEYVRADGEGWLSVDQVGLILECVSGLAARVRALESKTEH